MSESKKYFQITSSLPSRNWIMTDSDCLKLDHLFEKMSWFLYKRYRDFLVVTPEDIKQEIWVLFLKAKANKSIPRYNLLKLYVTTRIKRNLIGKGVFNDDHVVRTYRLTDQSEDISSNYNYGIQSSNLEDPTIHIEESTDLMILKECLSEKFHPNIVDAWFMKYVNKFPHHYLKKIYNSPVSYETMQINYFPRIKKEIQKILFT